MDLPAASSLSSDEREREMERGRYGEREKGLQGREEEGGAFLSLSLTHTHTHTTHYLVSSEFPSFHDRYELPIAQFMVTCIQTHTLI